MATLPADLRPQLATLVQAPPRGAGWVHEIKLDGYRLLCFLAPGRVRLVTRKGNDWTARYPAIARAAGRLRAKSAVLDGEAVVYLPDGRTSFQALQEGADPVLAAFDLLFLDGSDLRSTPLLERKRALLALLGSDGPGAIRYGDHVAGRGERFYEEACRAGLEGIVSKRADAPYTSGRSRSWLKVKCVHRQEFVVAGFTEPSGARAGLGALLLAVHDDGRLRYAGKVGTGFRAKDLPRMRRDLESIERPDSALEAGRPRLAGVHWTEPERVVEVAFREWTSAGHVRQPSFQGFREDRDPRDVVREEPGAPAPPPRRSGAEVAGVRLTHPGRILFPGAGLSKRDLALYYEAVAGAALPELAGRPLTLLRCPEGIEGECFHQKRAGRGMPDTVPRVDVGKEGRYLMIDGLPSLIALVQSGVLEFHVWGSRADRLERPDRLVLDIDPGSGTPWSDVVATAGLLRARLESLGLAAFPRATGGKGIHVVVPIERRLGWAQAKAFTRALAREMVRETPGRFTTNLKKSARQGRIFLDYLRNQRGATAVGSYSVRARPGAPVAVPVSWEELEASRRPLQFTPDRVVVRTRGPGADPWAGFENARRAVTAAARRAVEPPGPGSGA